MLITPDTPDWSAKGGFKHGSNLDGNLCLSRVTSQRKSTVQDSYGVLTIADGPARAIATQSGAYLEFYRTLADAIATGAPLPVEPADALSGLKILEAMHSSAATGAVIKISA